jgi:hypothetical protein
MKKSIRVGGLALALLIWVYVPRSVADPPKTPQEYWFVYDYRTPNQFFRCAAPVMSADCKQWGSTADVLESGWIIHVLVLHGKFRSTYTVAVNGFAPTENLPAVRGVSATPPVNQIAGQPSPKPETPPITPPSGTSGAELTVQQQFNALKRLYFQAENAIAEDSEFIASYEGVATTPARGNCPTSNPSVVVPPGTTLLELLSYAAAANNDARACSAFPENKFTNQVMFDNLTSRTDQLAQTIVGFNSLLPSKTQLTAIMQHAESAWEVYDEAATSFGSSVKDAATPEQKDYLDEGEDINNNPNLYAFLSYKNTRIQDADRRIGFEISALNQKLFQLFSTVNGLYENSESNRPYDIPLGQYNTSYVAQFQVHEIPGFTQYALSKAVSVTNPSSASPQPAPSSDGSSLLAPNSISQSASKRPFGDAVQPAEDMKSAAAPSPKVVPTSFTTEIQPAKKAPAPQTQQQTQTKAQTQAQLPPVASAPSNPVPIPPENFVVHKFYRANIVSGFFASTIPSRPYGVTNNGQATSSSNAVLVPVVGASYRPQFHYFVGLDLYLWRRDLYPGQLRGRDYRKPGLLLGYGLDAPNNYLIGLNWELRWGINLGSGFNIGQETFLAPGIQPGVTVLQPGTTTPPTTNRTAYGAFASIGFDLATVKAAITQLASGGVSPATK